MTTMLKHKYCPSCAAKNTDNAENCKACDSKFTYRLFVQIPKTKYKLSPSIDVFLGLRTKITIYFGPVEDTVGFRSISVLSSEGETLQAHTEKAKIINAVFGQPLLVELKDGSQAYLGNLFI